MKAHYFVADLHLGARGDVERRTRFSEFLTSIRDKAASLFIVGDLFEFGYEYRRGISAQNQAVASELAQLARTGIRIVLIKGNHDCWLTSRFEHSYGIELRESPWETSLEGRRALFVHGDKLDRFLKTRLTNTVFRNRVATRLFRFLPQTTGDALALLIADISRVRVPNPILIRQQQEYAQARLGAGFDMVVLAHVHQPALVPLNSGFLLNPGDWITHFSYGVLDSSGLRLETFQRRIGGPENAGTDPVFRSGKQDSPGFPSQILQGKSP